MVLGAICVRSDVERQRLARAGEIRADKLYSRAAINRTYEALAVHARTILECGYPAIVDATFLEHDHRHRFLGLARELRVPFVILSLHAQSAVLETRIEARQAQATDASEATLEVLRQQRENMEELSSEEREAAFALDGTAEPDVEALARRILGRRPAPWLRRPHQPIRDQP
jgi:predicted kinase